MKRNNILKSACFALFLGGLASCDVLDVQPLDSYTEDGIFSNAKLTEAYITKNYTRPRNAFGRDGFRFLTDECMENFNTGNSNLLSSGGMTPDQLGNMDIWSEYYNNIKNINIFFSNIDKVKTIPQPMQDYLIGEATFFRAFYYMSLVNQYGGVPLVTDLFELDDPDMLVKRNTYEECVDFVEKEFFKASELLPEHFTGENFGRATKGAALALRSRMLLYAASPQFNPDNNRQKWEKAKAATELVFQCGYELDNDYKGLFLNPMSKEIIFQRLYNTEFGHFIDWYSSPNGWSGYSCTSVYQEMVDSYEMEDGSMPTLEIYADGVDNPWAGRDPRFYASIVCNGQDFRGVEVEFWTSKRKVTNDKGEETWVDYGGRDSGFGNEGWNCPKTNYTMRKFLDENLTKAWSDKGKQPWIYCRYGEILLNYAEIMYNLGDEATAREYVNKIRKRARGGREDILPDVTESGAALLEKIQHERKIELAFEEHRYFDVRRWKIAETVNNEEYHGIDIFINPETNKVEYSFPVKLTFKFTAPNHYLFPIPNYERRKNDLLEQNPGYSGL